MRACWDSLLRLCGCEAVEGDSGDGAPEEAFADGAGGGVAVDRTAGDAGRAADAVPADAGVASRCCGCGPERDEACNGADDDCDGLTDEGVLNACGACGPVPLETCNGRDDDCDGETDEGTRNASTSRPGVSGS